MIGTAGHVDHGKSSLIEALTGTHPDRLQEERERQMTIDLGFGWLRLPDGREVGIIDVPGHRDFVENMLAGVTGIDVVLLVIAADEGIMPQTQEHLAILDLLRIRGGIIVLSKTDLISDPDQLRNVHTRIQTWAGGTILSSAPIVDVSSKTGAGIPTLLEAISVQLAQQPDRTDLGRPRLPVDRVFSLEGFGTVVTGTLNDGELAVGDEVEILPSAVRGRIRGLQTHHRKVEQASPGSRTAVNIASVAAASIRRGDVLTHPGTYGTTRRVDAQLRVLPQAAGALVHGQEVKVFVGTAERVARLRLLGADELKPGDSGWVQLEAQEPFVCTRGDLFVLRIPSPAQTIGGGQIIDPAPAGRHKRFDLEVIASMRARADGDPTDLILEATKESPASIKELLEQTRLERETLVERLGELEQRGELVWLGDPAQPDVRVVSAHGWNLLAEQARDRVAKHLAGSGLRSGMSREELRNGLGLPPQAFAAMTVRLVQMGLLVENGGMISLPGHSMQFTAAQKVAVDALLKRFEGNPYAPPSERECEELVGKVVLHALKELGSLVAVSEDVLFRRSDYEELVAGVRELLENADSVTLAQVRDHFGTSRRYAQALLEHLDAKGVTRRVGDARILAQR